MYVVADNILCVLNHTAANLPKPKIIVMIMKCAEIEMEYSYSYGIEFGVFIAATISMFTSHFCI